MVDIDDLVDKLEPGDVLVFSGDNTGIVQAPRHRLVECLDDQAGLAPAGYAAHAGQNAKRDIHRHVFQVVGVCARYPQAPFLVEFAAFRRYFNLQIATQVLGGQTAFRAEDCRRFARCNDLATMHARADPHVDQVIRRSDGFLVMFDHEDGVADVAQVPQRFQQSRIVPLMQAD